MFHCIKKATYVFTMIKSLLEQLKERRLALGLKQTDMLLRVGVSSQQYQRLESKGNPRLDTLELIAKGFNSELMLIPKEKRNAVLAVLNEAESSKAGAIKAEPVNMQDKGEKTLSDDPWQGLLGDDS